MIDEKGLEIALLKDLVDKKDEELVKQKQLSLEQRNEIDDLKMKGGELSKSNFDNLNSKLNLSITDIKQKDR